MADDITISGGPGGTVEFRCGQEPRPVPTLEFPEDAVFSEHQMLPGDTEPGELVIQHWGVDITRGSIEMNIPFATTAQRDTMESKWLTYPAPTLTITLDDSGEVFTALMTRFRAPRRTPRKVQYELNMLFRVLTRTP